MLQVAQAAVDYFLAVRRCRVAEIALVDERDIEPMGGGTPGNGGAIDTAADNQHIEYAIFEVC